MYVHTNGKSLNRELDQSNIFGPQINFKEQIMT